MIIIIPWETKDEQFTRNLSMLKLWSSFDILFNFKKAASIYKTIYTKLSPMQSQIPGKQFQNLLAQSYCFH